MVAIPLIPTTDTSSQSATMGIIEHHHHHHHNHESVTSQILEEEVPIVEEIISSGGEDENGNHSDAENDPSPLSIMDLEDDTVGDSGILKLELLQPLLSSPTSSCFFQTTCKRPQPQQTTRIQPKRQESVGKGPASAVVYKEVVVVGNGPSGIALSYFLAGNWPYYNGCGESVNEMLHYRLLAAQKQSQSQSQGSRNSEEEEEQERSSIVEQDLRFLAQGLEGRSSNPVALLFDTLNHPEADLGLELPSLLTWRRNENHAIDHVVIGKGPPGGAWQLMDGNVLTISLGCWMELPQMNFRDWEASQQEKCGVRGESRASVASVAQYYCDYVRAHELEQYFVSNSEITEVTRIPCSASSRLPQHCDNLPNDILQEIQEEEEEKRRKVRRHTISEIPVNEQSGHELWRRNRTLWHVKGFTRTEGRKQEFSYLTKNLVLATGSSDSPNILNVPGEHLDFVLHSLKHLEQLIMSGQLNKDSDPILVVGAGLSAADAIIAARFHSIPVIHVFRRTVEDKNLIFKQLPENMYPEYHKVYQMMQDPLAYDGYKAYEQHVVAEIRPDRRVKLMGPISCGVAKVSNIVICIGSHPDLSFLQGLERNLGVHPGLPIDCKRNPIAINVTTHESVREPGLFALGPLVGENFVRFLQGGALAITNHLNQTRNKSSSVISITQNNLNFVRK